MSRRLGTLASALLAVASVTAHPLVASVPTSYDQQGCAEYIF